MIIGSAPHGGSYETCFCGGLLVLRAEYPTAREDSRLA